MWKACTATAIVVAALMAAWNATSGQLPSGYGLVESGTVIGLDRKLILDDDSDSYIYCSADDVCHWYVGGSEMLEGNKASGMLFVENNTLFKDGKQLRFGTSTDYYHRYNSASGAYEFIGLGGAAVIMHAIDAEGTVYFDKQIVVTGVSDTAPSEPFACDVDHFGAVVPVDDTDDTSWSSVCTCANLDGTGYDWRDASDVSGTACPFF